MTVADYRRLFAYEFWANRIVHKALTDDDEASVRLFSHILASQTLWLERMTGQTQSMAVWPDIPVEQAAPLLARLESAWQSFLGDMDDARLAEEFSYVNTKGQAWTSRIDDTLLHLITHSCYHRGQIAQEMRRSGREPVYTDYIQATRTESI